MPEHQILKSNKGLQIYFVVVKMSKLEKSTIVKIKKKLSINETLDMHILVTNHNDLWYWLHKQKWNIVEWIINNAELGKTLQDIPNNIII